MRTPLLSRKPSLEEIVRLYGLRTWVEQNYKHVKHALGWAQYQVRSDEAIRRDFQLVCCAFSFCWYYVSHPNASVAGVSPQFLASAVLPETDIPGVCTGTRKKNSVGMSRRPQVSWPRTLRAVRAWLEPWIMLRRYWRAWSEHPPPDPLQGILDAVAHGQPLSLSCTF